jgi:carbohydrate kinase (thermoresistant glucokinase family)
MNPTVVVVMGVSGSGKTTVGKLIADRLGAVFEEGDDYHPPENVAKMRAGIPLDDADRAPWLDRLSHEIDGWLHAGRISVLACSALKDAYRQRLGAGREGVVFVFLRGSPDVVGARLEARRGHYMPAGLLRSQFEALEEPADALVADVAGTPDQIADGIVARITALQPAALP